jgi:7-cyano-7-deazaguanine synthase
MTTLVQSISGGMDSTCLALHHLAQGRELYLLSFDYGQKHRLELERLDANLALFQKASLPLHHVRLHVPFGALVNSALTTAEVDCPTGFYADENMKATVVPNRNAIFSSFCFAKALSIAVERDETIGLSLGVHAGDHDIYPDCRPEFFEAIHRAYVIGNWDGEKVQLDLPFLHLDKAAILRVGVDACQRLGLDFDEVLSNTSTSYAPTLEGLADGRTGSDVERVLAFHEIGRIDPIEYRDGWEATLAYALKAKTEWERVNSKPS